MTTANTFIAKSAQIAGASYTGLVRFSVSKSGTAVDMRSDGELYQRKSALVGIVEMITVQLRDFTQVPALGATGSTILKGAQHANGASLGGAGTTRVCTATNSTVEAVEHDVDIDGRPVVNVTVSVQSADGVTSGIAWTAE